MQQVCCPSLSLQLTSVAPWPSFIRADHVAEAVRLCGRLIRLCISCWQMSTIALLLSACVRKAEHKHRHSMPSLPIGT